MRRALIHAAADTWRNALRLWSTNGDDRVVVLDLVLANKSAPLHARAPLLSPPPPPVPRRWMRLRNVLRLRALRRHFVGALRAATGCYRVLTALPPAATRGWILDTRELYHHCAYTVLQHTIYLPTQYCIAPPRMPKHSRITAVRITHAINAVLRCSRYIPVFSLFPLMLLRAHASCLHVIFYHLDAVLAFRGGGVKRSVMVVVALAIDDSPVEPD